MEYRELTVSMKYEKLTSDEVKAIAIIMEKENCSFIQALNRINSIREELAKLERVNRCYGDITWEE